MKRDISSDMEGSTGVVRAAQVDCTKPQYLFGRAMQAADVEAAVRAALEAGAEGVVINDSHCTMTNLDIAKFGGEVQLITGTPASFARMMISNLAVTVSTASTT